MSKIEAELLDFNCILHLSISGELFKNYLIILQNFMILH